MGVRSALKNVVSEEVVEAISLYVGLSFPFPYSSNRLGLQRLPLDVQNSIREFARPASRYYVPDTLWWDAFPLRLDAPALEEFGLWVRRGMPVDVTESFTPPVLDPRVPWRVDSL